MGSEQVEMVEIPNRDGASEEIELPAEHHSVMNLQIWLACIALGLSYTTAIQQHSCTASIVKHIDIALVSNELLLSIAVKTTTE